MSDDEQLTNLTQLLARIRKATEDRETLSMEELIEEVGTRSFGPLLLLVGLILFSPLSGIPFFPTLMGVLVFLISGQLLIYKRSFWLPNWLIKRSVSTKRLRKAIRTIRKPAAFIDRYIQPRLTFLTSGAGVHIIALLCLALALIMPLMEVVPFSATIAGLVIAILGLSLVANDGLVAIIAFSLAGLAAFLFIRYVL
ncbi:exopolysaccharide biosynthesis protein [Marinimicrobium alkaliphilum]|uniref:exopolysaccharide biosynthesis protein n=1 Tax=Marinimicrobium alkaliphilum TaxID=2202654 RepID=UPI000DB96AE0|nr:exopolysaccharide biosynthesis protein [Marinimicrobium alkaliphilum]